MIQNLFEQKVDLALCDKLVDLTNQMLLKLDLMPADSKDAWLREILASAERVNEIRAECTIDASRETTHKDRAVVMMHLSLGEQFTKILGIK